MSYVEGTQQSFRKKTVNRNGVLSPCTIKYIENKTFSVLENEKDIP